MLKIQVVKDYNENEVQARCTLKVNLMKALDSVIWDFINFAMPSLLSFPGCVCLLDTGVHYFPNILLGCEWYFSRLLWREKGSLTGDHLSPYSFGVAMEVLARLLDECGRSNRGFQFHYRWTKVNLSLTFVLLMIFWFSLKVMFTLYVAVIKSVLLEFESLSGLRANLNKSKKFCAGIPSVIKAQI
jgi:hypothetical protein